MPDLNFAVTGAEVPAYAAAPGLLFKLRIANARADEVIQSIVLRCQIMLAVARRRYSPAAQTRLVEVFGEPQRWGETLRPLLWTHASTVVPGFVGETLVDLPVPCTYDFEVAATKYFDALEDGEVPLEMLFSGTYFYEGAAGQLQVGQIAWSKEAAYRLPVALWREMIGRFYPNSAWLRLDKAVFDRLYAYKMALGLPTWEDAIAQLLQGAGEEVAP